MRVARERCFTRILLIMSVVALLSGCATNQAFVMPDKNFKNYKTAYVEVLQIDEFNLGTFIITELSDMGLQVVNKRVSDSELGTSMIVRYSYTTGWDLTKYMKSYQVLFLDAQTEAIIANIAYRSTGIWIGNEARKVQGFNELRSKLGLSPSKYTE